ncbi:LamG-like jellyroll fold domain-containing protein [Carboxylicivirga marina]|uniref:PKD domain-containing protein n=1 Tax=Carboxylicivirga marina TaxID=2800988 RepID=A0ABS1HJW3_9BACT|nr:LamG-like jellyroll fold domain-containing protein [Carboxylicivirga marina]MBK3517967.1 PKD domain-containing protein [Carboxylicivirga marina]
MKNLTYKLAKLTIGLCLSLALINCSESDEEDFGPVPVADFEASEVSVIEKNEIVFTDLSSNEPNLWTWQFAGGSPTYSNEQNPTVRYDYPGIYSVTLTVRNAAGGDEIIKTDYIEVTGKPIIYKSKYAFDDDLTDAGTNGITALSNFGDPVYVVGKFGKAWQAPGVTDQYLTIPEYKGIGVSGSRTIMAWFKTSVEDGRKAIVSYGVSSRGTMFNVMIDKGKVRVEGGGSSLISLRSGLDNGEWHHVAVTYNPEDGPLLQDVKIYVDGSLSPNDLDGSYRANTTNIDTDAVTNDVMIGHAVYGKTGYFFPGEIDDVRILEEVLIEEQIADIVAGN